jgi:drug/metabolite transporter (DMT)-like permease
VWLLKNAPISLVATYAYVNPVVAMLIGWTFLSETFSPMIILAGGAIIAAVVLIVSAPTPSKEYGWGLRRRDPATEEAVTVSSHGR